MSYSIESIDVRQPLPDLRFPPGTSGVAILVRDASRPVGFFMHPVVGPELSAEQLRELIGRHTGLKLLTEAIDRELRRPIPEGPPVRVSVVICTKDRPALVERCLRSIAPLRTGRGAELLEVLVIDNAPTDERTRKVVESIPWARYVVEPKPGLNFARNRAIEEASGEILAYLDDDVVVDRGWMGGLREALSENADAGAITGLVLPYELATRAQILFEQRGGFRRGFDKLRYHGQRLPGNPLYPCGAGIFGAGCNMAFRRRILERLGGFDEALDTGPPLPGGGDLDIFFRVIRAGYPLVYEPSFLVFHQHRRELAKLRRQYWTWGAGFMAFLAKSYGSDPVSRARLRATAVWWFGDELRQLAQSVCGRHPLPPQLVLAELLGGVIGLLGTYPRSVRRIQRIRQMQVRHT